MDLRFIQIPKVENDTILEDLSKDILKCDTNLNNVSVHGRPGQKQDGIDVFCRRLDNNNWIGIQCKVRSTNSAFTLTELLAEVNQALKFNPSISEYYLYTTLSRDTVTQGFVRDINTNHIPNNAFSFEVKFWEDIADMLKEKKCENVYYRYFFKYFRDNQTLGHAIGKLINLNLQFDGIPDTKYELMIGKIPKNEDDGKNVDYFRDTYFIANLLDHTIEHFRKSQTSQGVDCFPSDIEQAFSNKIDCYRISRWLESIEIIDDFIYNDTHNYSFSITSEEQQEYFRDDD
ncbi:hypothetical protein SD960_20920 [Flavobacterium sp. MMLR14_040]|uniref:hypothetical protein n=1 Tax=Flavobacterium sp. MMLR14_040 TaxID=3093843 RepID=UPI00298FEA6E|nr:hypothetical protein [Flavobacterium sp. MMLR14_040]MDW8852577.1 hypothetical protein [Flavobacterium sp. MMLR14_040]